ncbi:MAG: AAA family ATPase [Cyclobacteriaceae bacterium]
MITDEQIQSYLVKFQDIVRSEEFYFEKGRDKLNQWLNLALTPDVADRISTLSNDYDLFLREAERDQSLNEILELLFQITAYCDRKARDKAIYNEYDDKRALADANVRMNNWVQKLVQYRLDRNQVEPGSVLNAINFLLEPENNSSILSEKHRALIYENLLKEDYHAKSFVASLKKYFSEFNIVVVNPENYTYLLAPIVYQLQSTWKEEVVGLMASDGTGWHDDFISRLAGYQAGVVWNTKRPSGTAKTLKFLRELVKEGSTFNIYYSAKGFVNYVASVIDFAESQDELNRLNWHEKYNDILDYQNTFTDYNDGSKTASIIFLIDKLEKIDPVPVSRFKFYGRYDVPRQDNLSPIKVDPFSDRENEVFSQNYNDMQTMELNTILYGPPGTGKTYNSINYAVSIIEDKDVSNVELEKREDVKSRFDKYCNSGEIVFTTFHQSMTYEDFIEGLKPISPEDEENDNESNIQYAVRPGIFRKICDQARISITSNQDFDELWSSFYKSLDKEKEVIFTSTESEMRMEKESTEQYLKVRFLKSYDTSKSEGTRVFTVGKDAIRKIFDQKVDGTPGASRQWVSVRDIVGAGRATLCLGVYKKFWEYAKSRGDITTTESLKPHVLIIDEINRGNVSQIFGELITLLEDDKREGMDEAIELMLPYSKYKFTVPSNLFILGTMNTADRSVEAIDTALRRRFSFVEMPPRYDLKELQATWFEVRLADLLKTINKRLEKLLSKDHLIGHSYFLSIKSSSDLKAAFQRKLIPLLQEYFYGDFGKIGLVLGSGFFEEHKEDKDADLFAKFHGYDAGDLMERSIYRLKNVAMMTDDIFSNALQLLMKTA